MRTGASEAPAGRAGAAVTGRPHAEERHEVASRGSDSRRRRSLLPVVRSSLCTLCPFVAADALSLLLCGWIAQLAVEAISLPLSLSPLSAAFAMLPLLVGYWLSGIYGEIWIHPAVEFRQLTHVNTIAMLCACGPAMIVSPNLAIWLLAAWASAVVVVPLLRNLARAACVNRRGWGYPTLIIGSGASGDEAARLVLDCPRSGLR